MSKRVLIADFNHETNTFSKMPTPLSAFRARILRVGEEILATYPDTATEIAGFLDAGQRFGWQIVPTVAADATPSGLVTKDAFDFVVARIFEGLHSAGPIDGILLALHGAMVCEHDFDGEGALLEAIRGRVGQAMPIGVTLDLHANVTDRMAALADTLVSYRTYPHIDHRETAAIAAELMARQLSGTIRPKCYVARRETIYGVDMGRTTAPGSMTRALDMARALEREPGVLSVSINAGFPWADIPDAGPTAVVVGEGDEPRYQAMAQRLADYIWETRAEKVVTLLSVKEAIDQARAAAGGKPVVLADYADNPGGGGYGDSPGLLRGMIEARLENAAFSMLYDPESARACHAAGSGATLSLRLGAKIDPAFGAPIEATGTVTKVFDGRFVRSGPMLAGIPVDMGPSAAFKVGGVEIVIGSERFQNADLMYFRSAGIEPTSRAFLGVKSMQHFRAAYAPIAGAILVVDEGGGCCSENFKALRYRHVRRPVYPLDLD
jgi:microcystin degradation protein MlrC